MSTKSLSLLLSYKYHRENRNFFGLCARANKKTKQQLKCIAYTFDNPFLLEPILYIQHIYDQLRRKLDLIKWYTLEKTHRQDEKGCLVKT